MSEHSVRVAYVDAYHHDESGCRADEHVMDFVGYVGAPGRGSIWECTTCGREWLKLGLTFVDPSSGPHELDPADVV